MKSKYSVSEAEWEVLKMLWKHGEPIRQAELLALFAEKGKEWKRQTLNTFLFRLEEKGLVKRENGKARPVYDEEEYNALLMRETIDALYGGKFSALLASFVKRNDLSEEDMEEMRRMLDR